MKLDVIREKLLARRRVLLMRYGKLQDDKKRRRGSLSADWQEQALEIENDEVIDGLEHHERSQLDEIEVALGRIDSNTYGICQNCTKQIDEKRLEAIPQTSLCLKCAS